MSKVVELREALEMSQKEFALFLGLSPSTVNSWEKRGNVPNADLISVIIKKVEKEYRKRVNIDFFYREGVPMFVDPNPNMRIVDKTSPRGSQGAQMPYYMPVYGRISAGQPLATWGGGEYEIPIAGGRLENIKGDAIGFEVYGDSMDKIYGEGDIVYVTEIKNPLKIPDGTIVVAFFDSDPETARATVKMFQWEDKKKGTFLLIPNSNNPVHKIGYYSLKELRKIFRVYCGLKFV